MTDADTAYAAAKKAIAKAKASGARGLNLAGYVDGEIYKALDRLPPEITDLKNLKMLALWGTQISDISVLRGMTRLTQLNLSGMQISDIAPLQGMTGLTELDLSRTQISDISALQGMTGLTGLDLFRTQINDISALQGMTRLTGLDLSYTQITDTDLPLLATLQNLSKLNLSGTEVLDLSPLRVLALLTSAPGKTPLRGLHFKNTAATHLAPRIAEIAEIRNNSERARVLFDFLKDWVPPPRPNQPADGTTQAIPPRRPAPLEVAVTDDRISRVGPGPLPLADAQDRAQPRVGGVKASPRRFWRGLQHPQLPAAVQDPRRL